MTARELFSACGFVLSPESFAQQDYILYEGVDPEDSTPRKYLQIYFSRNQTCVNFRAFSIQSLGRAEFDVSPEVLMAVCQQCKELGWIE